MGKPFNYGGQAVLEGVMMRGSHTMAVAVRAPNGQIVVKTEPLNEKLYTGPISRIPFAKFSHADARHARRDTSS